MSNIYQQDRTAVNNSDFGGSGIGSGRYDEKEDRKERLKEAKLPIVLLLFFIFCTSILIYLSVSEFVYYTQGTAITGTVNTNANFASYTAPDGHKYTVTAAFAKLKANEEVTIYYMNNHYSSAQIMSDPIVWIAGYLVFGLIIAFCIYLIYKSLHRTNHATTKHAQKKYY